MSTPLVSIIIPTYNRAHLIGETLDSVLAQTYTNWECIIVNDGSTDNTDEVVNQYLEKDNRFQYHHRPADRLAGGNAARNYGFELSKGEYVNWFDDDDIMVKNKLKIQVDAMNNNEFNFSVCQTLVFQSNVSNVLGKRHERIISETPLYDFIQHKIAFLTQAPFFKVKFLKDNGLRYDENLYAAQEWEFICRLLYYSPTYHVVKEPLVLIRKHKNSITYNDEIDLREWNYYIARRKIFYFLKSRDNFYLKLEILNYLKKYFTIYFKTILFKKQPKKIITVFIKSIYPFNSFYKNIKIISILAIILLTGKGYRFRKFI